MADSQYKIDDFIFDSQAEYERAKKEKETIAYIKANTDSDSTKELLKVYNKSVNKGSFQTIFGYLYLQELRQQILAAGVAEEEMLAAVPVKYAPRDGSEIRLSTDASAKEVRRYKLLYEDIRDRNKILKMAVGFLVIVIVAMVAITYQSKYSVFTYFSDYEHTIRTEIEDEYAKWQESLQQREDAVKQKEAELGIGE